MSDVDVWSSANAGDEFGLQGFAHMPIAASSAVSAQFAPSRFATADELRSVSSGDRWLADSSGGTRHGDPARSPRAVVRPAPPRHRAESERAPWWRPRPSASGPTAPEKGR